MWMTGSLNGRGWDEAAPLGWALLVLLPFVLWAARAQRDGLAGRRHRHRARRPARAASGSGWSRSGWSWRRGDRGGGPVDFVALLAPQIARRLTRTAQIPLLCSALLGACWSCSGTCWPARSSPRPSCRWAC